MRTLSLLVTTVLAAATASRGAIVFSETFADNDRTNNPTWYSQIGSLSGYVSVSGGVLTLSNTANANRFLGATWSGSSFTQEGDKLTFTATVKYGDAGSSVDTRGLEFNFSVGNNNGTPRTSDTAGTTSDDKGYVMSLGGSASGANGSAIRSDAGTANHLGSGGDLSTIVSGSALAAETFKTFTLTITQNNLGNFNLSMTDGTTTLSSLNQAPLISTFNSVTFGAYLRHSNNTLDVDSITVDFTPAPEPTAASMLGLFGLLLRRRRR